MADKNKILMKAQRYALKGYIEKAVKEYKKIVEVDPQDIIIRLRLGELYAKMGKREEAIEEYSKVAGVHTQKGFFLKAIAVYKQILKLDNSNTDVHLNIGDLYKKQGLLADAVSQYSRIVERYEMEDSRDKAIDVLKKMIDINPNNLAVKARLANNLYESGLVEDAFVEFESIAKGLIGKGDPDKAEKIYRKFLDDGVENIRALEGLSEVYRFANKNEDLLETYRELLKLYIESGLEAEIKDVCRNILKIDPNDKEAIETLSEEKPAEIGEEEIEVLPEEYVDLVAELGLEEEAPSLESGAERPEEVVEETSEQGDLETHYYTGVAYMGTGLLDEAIKELKMASSSPRVAFDCYIRLGLCYMDKKEPKEAIKYFDKGLEIPGERKDRYSLFYELGLAYEAMGEREKALEFFKEIEKEDKDFREVRSKIEALSTEKFESV